MRTIKILSLPFVFIMYLIIALPLQSCDPDDDCSDEPECDSCSIVYKPNIYIYPNAPIELTVKLNFPMGGEVITSIPEYGTGWHVMVDTSGLIDNSFSYLFYESTQPDIWQNNNGWNIQTDKLELFFRQNMAAYGFNGREITDFVDYWIPRLTKFSSYSIYPQTKNIIDDVIQLDLSKQPERILRLFYVIKGHNDLQGKLTAPTVNSFKREGYFITEWGVILK